MISYVPALTEARGLCLILAPVTEADRSRIEDLIDSLRERDIATVSVLHSSLLVAPSSPAEATIALQTRILGALRFADDQLPDVRALIVIDTESLPSLLALMRGRPTSEARVHQILLVREEIPLDLDLEVDRRLSC